MTETVTIKRTNALRKRVRELLLTIDASYAIKGVYYDIADPDAMYPHIVIGNPSTDNSDEAGLKVYTVDIELCNLYDIYTLEDIADDIEDIFCFKNDPQTTILPTFFCEGRQEIEDADKKIRRLLVRLTAQVYEKEAITNGNNDV